MASKVSVTLSKLPGNPQGTWNQFCSAGAVHGFLCGGLVSIRTRFAAMAVVIQRMVRSEVAGVAFSMNPVTGALDQVVVNAAYGLGETVVSASL